MDDRPDADARSSMASGSRTRDEFVTVCFRETTLQHDADCFVAALSLGCPEKPTPL
jgi:hypothetical protein